MDRSYRTNTFYASCSSPDDPDMEEFDTHTVNLPGNATVTLGEAVDSVLGSYITLIHILQTRGGSVKTHILVVVFVSAKDTRVWTATLCTKFTPFLR